MTVCVEAAARLHFGVLDLRGTNGRWFGGLGAGAPAPTVLVEASLPAEAGSHEGASNDGVQARGCRLQSEDLVVEGEDADRAREFARRFLSHHGLAAAARIRVVRALPPHAGLGSGTQLGLSVARALAELHGIQTDAPALARAIGRGRRSAVGTWTFEGGGLVVEGGRRRDGNGCGPLLARLPFPPHWRCIVAVPAATSSIHGKEETAALAALPPPPERDVQRVAQLVLTSLLPAVTDDDLHAFGAALTEIQRLTGGWWAPVQGGTFAPASRHLIDLMTAAGVAGVGQSSWGPAVYGVVGTSEEAARVAAQLRAALGTDGSVYEGPFRTAGARLWHR